MRILFDQGTPVPLRHAFLGDVAVATAYEMGWQALTNGQLLREAEAVFDVFITTDQNLQYQQNLAGRRLAILVLPTTSWPQLKLHAELIAAYAASMQAGAFHQLELPQSI